MGVDDVTPCAPGCAGNVDLDHAMGMSFIGQPVVMPISWQFCAMQC